MNGRRPEAVRGHPQEQGGDRRCRDLERARGPHSRARPGGTLCGARHSRLRALRPGVIRRPPRRPEAGAHIGLHLPNGTVRQYSLLHTPAAPPRSYEIAVKLSDAASRGGSRFIHDLLRVGTILPIDPPRNNFPLCMEAPQSLFFAGGIGVTPILAMLKQLKANNKPAKCGVAARERLDLAFEAELGEACTLHLHIDAEQDGRFFDLTPAIAAAPRSAHLYCCGPAHVVAFTAATRDWPSEQIHLEYFTLRDRGSQWRLRGEPRAQLT